VPAQLYPVRLPMNRSSVLKLLYTRRVVRARADSATMNQLAPQDRDTHHMLQSTALCQQREPHDSHSHEIPKSPYVFLSILLPSLLRFRFCPPLTYVHQALFFSLSFVESQPLSRFLRNTYVALVNVLQHTRRRRQSPSAMFSVACLSLLTHAGSCFRTTRTRGSSR
jgi:hypothetical protein